MLNISFSLSKNSTPCFGKGLGFFIHFFVLFARIQVIKKKLFRRYNSCKPNDIKDLSFFVLKINGKNSGMFREYSEYTE